MLSNAYSAILFGEDYKLVEPSTKERHVAYQSGTYSSDLYEALLK